MSVQHPPSTLYNAVGAQTAVQLERDNFFGTCGEGFEIAYGVSAVEAARVAVAVSKRRLTEL